MRKNIYILLKIENGKEKIIKAYIDKKSVEKQIKTNNDKYIQIQLI